MKTRLNNFVLNVATVNGSGSQSANQILLKTIFRMGIPVGGKNVFPSNIAGLPTWFWIRANENAHVARRSQADIVVALNPQTLREDMKFLMPAQKRVSTSENMKSDRNLNSENFPGVFIYNEDIKSVELEVIPEVLIIPVPFKSLVDQVTSEVRLKKLVINMVYVGVLAELLKLDDGITRETIRDQFGGKAKAVEINIKAYEAGRAHAATHINTSAFPYKTEGRKATQGKILIDGNSAGALGLLCGGATFLSWYPITPSSSLAESFSKYAESLRVSTDGKKKYAVLQAEDELASICMVLGAGSAGARALTTTSGPGLSLMNEAIGFAYYAEIPAVIWDVQRVGPSTGMPTRTAQGDLFTALYASHGDTQHIVLLPDSPRECFEFGQTCFDLAEKLQTLVFVLSDLDIGMNLWMEDEFKIPTKPYDRGDILTEAELSKLQSFDRYDDPKGDGIPVRTLPGVRNKMGSITIRGSGHNKKAAYTERSDEYKFVVDRIRRKYETARGLVPRPVIKNNENKNAILFYGSTSAVLSETCEFLKQRGLEVDQLRVRALPLCNAVRDFIDDHEKVYVVDQNRDGQLWLLLRMEYPELCAKMVSLRHYDGTPITADILVNAIVGN